MESSESGALGEPALDLSRKQAAKEHPPGLERVQITTTGHRKGPECPGAWGPSARLRTEGLSRELRIPPVWGSTDSSGVASWYMLASGLLH